MNSNSLLFWEHLSYTITSAKSKNPPPLGGSSKHLTMTNQSKQSDSSCILLGPEPDSTYQLSDQKLRHTFPLRRECMLVFPKLVYLTAKINGDAFDDI